MGKRGGRGGREGRGGRGDAEERPPIEWSRGRERWAWDEATSPAGVDGVNGSA